MSLKKSAKTVTEVKFYGNNLMNRHSQNSTVQNKTLLLAVCEITKSFKFYHVIKYPPVVLGRCCVQGSHKSYLCYCQMMLVPAPALST